MCKVKNQVNLYPSQLVPNQPDVEPVLTQIRAQSMEYNVFVSQYQHMKNTDDICWDDDFLNHYQIMKTKGSIY